MRHLRDEEYSNSFVWKNERRYAYLYMLKHVYLIIGSTFIFGLVTGAIISLSTNTGGDGDGGISEESGFVVVARMYGGCARMGIECPSYRVSENGEYTYVSRTREGDFIPHRDTLSKEEREKMEKAYKDADLGVIEKSEFSGTCPITFDGLAFTYEIESESSRHMFDSCKQNVGQEELFMILEQYFSHFAEKYETE